jgi:hypothetical protein
MIARSVDEARMELRERLRGPVRILVRVEVPEDVALAIDHREHLRVLDERDQVGLDVLVGSSTVTSNGGKSPAAVPS